MRFPVDPGFHTGETTPNGRHGPFGGVSPKNPRLSGKNTERSVLHERS
jgi:hypothetical protein